MPAITQRSSTVKKLSLWVGSFFYDLDTTKRREGIKVNVKLVKL